MLCSLIFFRRTIGWVETLCGLRFPRLLNTVRKSDRPCWMLLKTHHWNYLLLRKTNGYYTVYFFVFLLQHLQNYIYTNLRLELLTYNYVLFYRFLFSSEDQKKKNSCVITVFFASDIYFYC